MRRRTFLAVTGAAATWPLSARAQQGALPVVGFLSSFTEKQAASATAALRRGIGENGLVEGQHITVAYRYADGQYDRLPALAAELVAARSQVIVASGRPAPFAARTVTTSIPILFVVSFDPVSGGLVDSMSRPRGNVTGVTHMSDALVQKRLEMLLELAPQAKTVAMLVNPDSPDLVPEVRAAREIADQRGIGLRTVQAKTPGEIDAAFKSLDAEPPDGLMVAADPFFLNRAEQLATGASKLARPAIFPFGEFPAVGGLISYGANRPNSYRNAGVYAARIVKGSTVTELPVMQPTLFDLVVNLKTAAALQITIPPALLARADNVIE